jgi:O-antigen/teichoic acid export membrane protein
VAATLPPVIALMVLARPLLIAWLGPRFAPAATALTIYLSYWVLNSSVGVGATMVQAAGRVRALAGWAWMVALANLALSLALTPSLGLDGVVLGTTLGWAITSPILLRLIITTLPVGLGDLAREVWVPTYGVGLVVAAGLLIAKEAIGINGIGPVIIAMSVAILAYWVLFWALCLRPGEREFFRSLINRSGRRRAEVGLIPRS